MAQRVRHTIEEVSAVSREGGTAVSSGLVKREAEARSAKALGARRSGDVIKDVIVGKARKAGSDADAGDMAAKNMGSVAATAAQAKRIGRSRVAAVAAEEADESDELSGTRPAYEAADRTRLAVARRRNAGKPEQTQAGSSRMRASKRGSAGTKDEKSRAYSKRSLRKSREIQANAQAAAAKATEATAKKGLAQAIASAASSMLAPLAGMLAGILAFIIGLLLVTQLVSSLFGFWENEAYKANMAGLPPYITEEMVITALECQERYGHPAGCTLAQIICESGCGDHLSGLATKDKNLFGIKWASNFALCPEVAGCSDYQTGEYYDGQYVTVTASFTSFKSYSDCIVFRSRVLLQGSRYADNPTIRRAISECDSDLMAEGLKDAGYATSPSYVESLKSIMDTYGLRRFDGMTVKEYEEQGKDGGVIVKAAYAQLGTPYVWGGTSPYRGLDCSGLTQWCYAQAGISIPKYSEDQHVCGISIPLSQARPGDILWRPGHVAIYIGGDQYIHAPQPGDVVRIASGINYFTCAVRYR